jgi:Flp pilus assembly protein TadG
MAVQPKRRRFRGDDGDVGPWAVMTPLAVGLVMLVLQIGITYHAKSVVTAAAQDGARAAQHEHGSADDAHAAVDQLLGSDRGLLRTVGVDVDRGADTVAVTVTAEVSSLVPLWKPTVTATVQGPVERFRNELER